MRAYKDLGPGCCEDREFLFDYYSESLEGCHQRCSEFPDCAFIVYGWKGSKWCSVLPANVSCSVLMSGPTDCRSSGDNGVHSYQVVLQEPSQVVATTTTAPGFFSGIWRKSKTALENSRVGPLVKKAEDQESRLKIKMAPVSKGLTEVYKGINMPNYNAPPHTEGNTVEGVNRAIYIILGMIVVATSAAACVDVFCRPKCLEGRPKAWAITLISISYILLIPGLTNVLLSFAIIVNVIGHRVRVHPGSDRPSCTESTPDLIQLLHESGGDTGATMLILFAMVVPAFELIFLFVGEIFRFRNCAGCTRFFRVSILWVQHRSKWASPDTFAYTLLLYLIRTLNNFPLILTKVQLDIGFSCFCLFCVTATIGSLGFPLPELPEEDRAKLEDLRPPLLLRCLGKSGMLLVVTLLGASFAVILVIGVQMPVIAFRINERPLFQPHGPLPLSAKPAVDALNIPQMLDKDVNLVECIVKLAKWWASTGEATCAIACIMWAVFALGITSVNVLLVVLSSWRVFFGYRKSSHVGAGAKDNAAFLGSCPFMAVSKVLKKLAMLDVAIAGCFLITYCMAIYTKIGVFVETRRGLLVLLAAELVHNLVYWLQSSIADYGAAKPAAWSSSEESSSELEAGPAGLLCACSGARLLSPPGSAKSQSHRRKLFCAAPLSG